MGWIPSVAEISCEYGSEHLGSLKCGKLWMSFQIESSVDNSPKITGYSKCFTLKVLLKFLLMSSI
jgi:hypothetical protein